MSTILLKYFLKTINNEDWTESKKQLTNFLSLLNQGISFNNLAEKYGYGQEKINNLNLIGLLKII